MNKVLTDSKYTKAAQALSRKLRARKNTPVEEAAGIAFQSVQINISPWITSMSGEPLTVLSHTFSCSINVQSHSGVKLFGVFLRELR